jgi:hypothetical protein
MARPRKPPGTPVVNVAGCTDPEFEGVGTPTLRNWLAYWCNERRCRGQVEREGIDRRDEIRRLQAEIRARIAHGRASTPPQEC